MLREFKPRRKGNINMKQISYLKVGNNKGNKRIWIEGKRLAECGFKNGLQYTVNTDIRNRQITISTHILGERSVSSRKRLNKTLPIIDLCNKTITNFIQCIMKNTKKIRVLFCKGKLVISIHHFMIKKDERESRFLNNKLSNQITTGTICSGGGISTMALHEGFSDIGLKSRVNYIVDLESKYLQSAIDNIACIDNDTIIIESMIEEVEPVLIEPVDILNISIPCTGHSKSGKAKNKLNMAEDHKTAGTSILGLINIIPFFNPSIIINENVCDFKNSASYSLLTGFLRQRGYIITERILGAEMGAIEQRNRHIMIAVSESFSNAFNIDNILPSMPTDKTLADIIENIPPESNVWKPYDYLKEKEIKDLKAGKGFKRQLLKGNEKHCGTIGRGYNKARSTEPFIIAPHNSEVSRLFTISEHANVKNIPVSTVAGVSTTVAHEILGQSVLYAVFKSIGRFLASGINSINILAEAA